MRADLSGRALGTRFLDAEHRQRAGAEAGADERGQPAARNHDLILDDGAGVEFVDDCAGELAGVLAGVGVVGVWGCVCVAVHTAECVARDHKEPARATVR